MKKTTFTILLIYLAVISVLEFAAFKLGGGWSVAGAWLWFATGLAVLGFFVFEILRMFVRDIKEKHFAAAALSVFLLSFFIFFIGNIAYSDINADSAQQLASGLDSFDKADLNYTGKAFLGYPARQYTLAALPAKLFGRNIRTFHAGFGLLFVIALGYLMVELRQWLKEKEMPEEYAFLAGFSFPVFSFITEYYMNFEQAFTPVALAAILCALYLRLRRKPDAVSFICLSWTGCFLSGAYTPALALLGLLSAFLVLYIIWYCFKGNSFLSEIPMLCMALIVNTCCFFLAGFSGRSDRVGEVREDSSVIKSALGSWKEFFTDKNASFLGVFGVLIIIYMLLSLLLRFKIYDFVISLWVLAVVFMSDYMKGYTSYEKAWVLQRNMIIIPVLITSVFITVMRLIKKHGLSINRVVVGAVLAVFIFLGMSNFAKPHKSFKYFNYVQPMKYLISDIYDSLDEYGLKETDRFAIVLYTDNSLQSNIYDYAKFFFPNAVVYSERGNEYDDNIDISRDEGLTVFFFSEDERLSEILPDAARENKKEHKNRRYDTKHLWFRKVLEP